MDKENITSVWNFLYHIICWDVSRNLKSVEKTEHYEASKKFLMLFPEAIRKVLMQLGSKQQVESIITKLFGETVHYSPSKVKLTSEIKRNLEKYCPELKPHAQDLSILIERNVRKAGGTREMSKHVWNLCLEIAKSLPLPPSPKMPPDLGEVSNIGMQDAVLQRLKEEMLPNEISEILKIIEEDRLPRDVLPVSEDFPVISSDEVSDNENKWKCEICGRVFQNSSVLRYHMKQEHLKMKSYTCDVCSQRFTFQSELKCHRKMHNHICTICKRVFTSKLDLMNHSVYHKKTERLELYRCKFCEKVFAFKSHLVTHEKQHILQQPVELNQPYANNDSSIDSLVFTRFKKRVEKFHGHACCMYILSSDRTLCYNKRDKRYHRVADIVQPFQVLLSDVDPTRRFYNR